MNELDLESDVDELIRGIVALQTAVTPDKCMKNIGRYLEGWENAIYKGIC